MRRADDFHEGPVQPGGNVDRLRIRIGLGKMRKEQPQGIVRWEEGQEFRHESVRGGRFMVSAARK
jgi:hypothetical protein